MKRFYQIILLKAILLLGCFLPGSMDGQTASQYIFSSSQGTYSYLSGSTPVTMGIATSSIPIGFSFNFCGTNYTTLKATQAGFIIFSGIQPNVSPIWCPAGNLVMNGNFGSPSYVTVGSSPDRVFIFEWKNWKWNAGDSANISFQVWLHETTNEISFRYKDEKGDFSISPAGSIGIASSQNDFLSLSSFLPVPVASSVNFSINPGCMPLSGQVYTFTPPIPCSGVPIVGSVAVPSDPWNLCTGNSFTLIDTGYSKVSGLDFQWQSSPNGSSWADVAGATDNNYTSAALVNTQYRLKLTCQASQDSSFTQPVAVTVAAPIPYQPLPYVQDFENWMGYCDKVDVPGVGWANNPATGQNSWARDDQGYFAGWTTGWYDYNSRHIQTHVSGDHSAMVLTANAQPGQSAYLDLHLDCSAQPGSKGLYFYYLNYGYVGQTPTNYQAAAGLDSLIVLMSTDGGISFTRLAAYTADTISWEKKHIEIPSSSSTTVLRFKENLVLVESPSYPIAIDSVFIAPPCSGTLVGGSIEPANTPTLCPGVPIKLTSIGASMGGDIKYQWQYWNNSGTAWSSVVDDTGFVLRIGGLYETTQFRMKVICNATGQVAFSNVVTINVQSPPGGGYATLPFIEDFETWISQQCDTNDVPGLNGITHWAAAQAIGFERFVREDTYGMNTLIPQSVKGAHSAMCFFGGSVYPLPDQFSLSNNTLDLLVDCSPSGSKTVQFYLNNKGHANPDITDQVKLYISRDGGASFENIGSWDGTNQWEYEAASFHSNSAQTVLRFAVEVPNEYNVPDPAIALDYLKVLMDCNGQPSAGTIDSVSTRLCANHDFWLTLSGTSAVKLDYQWQRSANGTTWFNIPGATTDAYRYSISSDTWFRCIVSCAGSGLSDTSAPKLFELLPFYFCYCKATPYTWIEFYGPNIGHVELSDSSSQATLINTGNPLLIQSVNENDYHRTSDYMDLPIGLFRDSIYKLAISELSTGGTYSSASIVRGYIDFNRDGIYDPGSEVIFESFFSNLHPVDSQFFHVPVSAGIGYTGMRLIMRWEDVPAFVTPPPGPCEYDGYWGEVEDYVVNINYAPCNGPLNAGTASVSDTLVLSGSSVQLINTTHANPDSVQLSQIAWIWQSSADGLNWTDIGGSEMLDTVDQTITVKTWFRLKIICQHSSDVTYSNSVYTDISNTGVANIPGSEALQLYPNPTTGKLNFKYLGPLKHVLTITTSDITGKQLSKALYMDIGSGFITDIDLSGYPRGVYLIQTTIDGLQFYDRVILK